MIDFDRFLSISIDRYRKYKKEYSCRAQFNKAALAMPRLFKAACVCQMLNGVKITDENKMPIYFTFNYFAGLHFFPHLV